MRLIALGLFVALAASPLEASAQDDLVVLVVDPGETRLNQRRLLTAIERTTRRSLVRMTDERAPMAHGRLTIAFSRPNRWVLRYEADGQVAWVSDRIANPRQLRDRLAELSRGLVNIVDGEPAAATAERPAERPVEPAERPRPGRRRGRASWDDVIIALQDEIVDPFANDPPPQRRPVTVLWSEVIDPFTEHRASRTTVGEVWSEVMDPWSVEHRPRR